MKLIILFFIILLISFNNIKTDVDDIYEINGTVIETSYNLPAINRESRYILLILYNDMKIIIDVKDGNNIKKEHMMILIDKKTKIKVLAKMINFRTYTCYADKIKIIE